MRKYIAIILFSALFISCSSNPTPTPNPPQLVCADYWAQVAFSNFCSMNISNYDLVGDQDSCGGDSNDSYANDELIYINVYNGFDVTGASEDYQDEKEAYDSEPNFVELTDLGDEAFAVINIEFGKLDDAYFSGRKGIYTFRIEINGNSANDSNNCFTPVTVSDFAKAIVAPL